MKDPKKKFWLMLVLGLVVVTAAAWFLGKLGGRMLVGGGKGSVEQRLGAESEEERAARIGRIERMEEPETPRKRSKSGDDEIGGDVETEVETEAAEDLPAADVENPDASEDVLLEDDEKPDEKEPGDTGAEGRESEGGKAIYRLQVGMFSSRENAAAVKNELVQSYDVPVYIAEVDVDGEKKFRVQAGAFTSRENAEKLARELRLKGHHTYIWKDEK